MPFLLACAALSLSFFPFLCKSLLGSILCPYSAPRGNDRAYLTPLSPRQPRRQRRRKNALPTVPEG
jgi:hypothetical protein